MLSKSRTLTLERWDESDGELLYSWPSLLFVNKSKRPIANTAAKPHR